MARQVSDSKNDPIPEAVRIALTKRNQLRSAWAKKRPKKRRKK